MRRERTEWLATWEAAGARPSADSALYQAEVTFGDNELDEQTVECVRHLFGPAFSADDLLERAELEAPSGCRWVQFTGDNDDSWNGAILYLGDKSVPARIVPPDAD